MPRGEFQKVCGTICNLPLYSPNVVTKLPRGNNSNGIVILKLKRKLQYKSSVYYDSVRSAVLLNFLTYLKANNPLYSNIVLITDNIPLSLSNLGHSDDLSDCDDDIDFDILKTCDEEIEDPMSDNRVSSSETTF